MTGALRSNKLANANRLSQTLSLSSLVSRILLSFLDRGLLVCEDAFPLLLEVWRFEASIDSSALVSAIINIHVNLQEAVLSNQKNVPLQQQEVDTLVPRLELLTFAHKK